MKRWSIYFDLRLFGAFLGLRTFYVMAVLVVASSALGANRGLDITAYGLTPSTSYSAGTWQWTGTKQIVYSCNPANPEFFCTFTAGTQNLTISSPAFTTDASGNASVHVAPSGNSSSGCLKLNGSSSPGGGVAVFSGYTDCQGTPYGTETWTIGEAPASCGWTMDVDLTRTCAGDGIVHTVEMKVGSTVVGGGTWPADVSNFTGAFSGTDTQGEVVSFWVDGVQMGVAHDVVCDGDPPPGNAFLLSGTFGSVCATPTPEPTVEPTPTPEPTATPAGTPPATPAPSSTPGATPVASPYVDPVPPGSGGGNPPPNPPLGTPPPGGMNVNIANPADFYAPMKEALEQAQSVVAPPPENGNSGGGMGNGTNIAKPELSPGDWSSLEEETNAIASKKRLAEQTQTNTLLQMGATIDGMPTTFGTVTSIPINFSAFGSIAAGMNLPASINLTPWLSAIGIVRLVLLWILRTIFWIKVIQIFAAQGATTKVVG